MTRVGLRLWLVGVGFLGIVGCALGERQPGPVAPVRSSRSRAEALRALVPDLVLAAEAAEAAERGASAQQAGLWRKLQAVRWQIAETEAERIVAQRALERQAQRRTQAQARIWRAQAAAVRGQDTEVKRVDAAARFGEAATAYGLLVECMLDSGMARQQALRALDPTRRQALVLLVRLYLLTAAALEADPGRLRSLQGQAAGLEQVTGAWPRAQALERLLQGSERLLGETLAQQRHGLESRGETWLLEAAQLRNLTGGRVQATGGLAWSLDPSHRREVLSRQAYAWAALQRLQPNWQWVVVSASVPETDAEGAADGPDLTELLAALKHAGVREPLRTRALGLGSQVEVRYVPPKSP